MTTRERLLAEHNGDAMAAFDHACRSIDFLAANASRGYMRAMPVKPGAAAKPRIEPLDVSSEQHPL